MSQEIKIISQKNLERIFKDNDKNQSDTRFIFLLGAGSSVQSGIPSAYKLADEWIKDIKSDLGEEYQSWINKEKIDEENIASFYTTIYNKRFEHNPKNGYETLQKLMENKEPSIGYTILSQILERNKHNFVITTNFDTLIEDALFLFTSKRPLVCGHEMLAEFIQLNSTRPTIIKVHRDILLNPYNTPDSTCSLNAPIEKALKPIISNSPMVVIGYGGHDKSIMDLLKEPQREPIYWCVRNEKDVSSNIKSILTNPADRIVKIDGFDELMVALHANVYDFKSINSLSEEDENKSLIVQNALQKVKNYKKALEEFRNEVKSSTSTSFKENSKSILPTWWDYQLKIYDEKDIEKKDKIFQEGIKQHPKSHELMGNYAIFLHKMKKDSENAEKYYLKALEIDPNHTNHNGNYALFLYVVTKDIENSEKYALKALEIDPNNANHNGNYANFLKNVKKDYENAEKYYLKALEIDPNHAINNGNYAGFLLSQGRKEESILFLDKAFDLTKDNNFLTELWFYKLAHFPELYDEAKKYLEKLLIEGYKSPNRDFSSNIKQAIKDNPKHIDEIKLYAERISGIRHE